MAVQPKIRPRDRDTIIQALSAGVVPRVGLHHIQVGRVRELQALVRDIERIADGGSAIRFVIGEYGAGKSFFLHLVRLVALEKRLLTVHADLGPDKRLHASAGQARTLYGEAVRNMATRTKPEGAALASVLERFVADLVKAAGERGAPVKRVLEERLAHLQEGGGGYDFATVVEAYWRGSDEGSEELKSNALRWLRGEFSTKTEARQALGVRNIIGDQELYEGLKLMAALAKLSGYAGLVVVFDEMVNLYKLQSKQARDQNYEQILAILNDVLQGNTSGIGFVFGGTPEFLTDTRRGLYSYAALQSRLAENSFARDGLIDLSGPVLRLQSLTPEELMVLLSNVRNVFAGGDPARNLVPDDALHAFMAHCSERIGEAYFRTPRNTVKAFCQLLSVLEQNRGTGWDDLISGVPIAADIPDEEEAADAEIGDAPGEAPPAAAEAVARDDELSTFKL
jgi:hypothetical protein